MIKTTFIPIFKSIDLARRKIPLIINESGNPGPAVWLAAAIHGDEVTGTEVALRLNRYLKRNPLLKGKVYSLPVMNLTGFELASRYETSESADLNRCFPGSSDGTAGERIAHKIFSEITATKPDLVIDLHTDTMESIPYLYLDPVINRREKRLAQKILEYANISGINYFVENIKDYRADFEGSITGALNNTAKIPAITMELGGPMVVKEKFVEVGLNVVKNLLSHLGMIDPKFPRWVYPHKILLEGIYETVWHRYMPDYSGIIEYRVQPGDLVKKGEPLARIKNLFDQTVQIIEAEEDSVVLSYADQSFCFPGTELFQIARRNDRALLPV